MPSDTPLTDAEILNLDCEDSCCAVYVKKGDTLIEGDIVSAEFARKLEIYNTQLAREVVDDERWIREVLTDFGIPFDDHKVGRRIALTQWMAEQGRGDQEKT